MWRENMLEKKVQKRGDRSSTGARKGQEGQGQMGAHVTREVDIGERIY